MLTRRRLLGGSAVLAVSALGSWWLFSPSSESAPDPLPDLPAGVASATFDWGDDAATDFDPATPPTADPIVAFDGESGTVSVEGVLTYGSSEGHVIHVQSVTLDRTADALGVTVSWAEGGPARSCSDDLAHDPYSLTLQFDTAVPEAVTVTERHFEPSAEGDTETRTVQVERPQ